MKRALLAWDLDRLTAGHVELLRGLEGDHDELVVVVTAAEEAFTAAHPRSAGERIAAAAPILRAALRRPFYLLPIKRGALSFAQWVARVRIGSPSASTWICHDDDEARVVARASDARVLRCPAPAGETIDERPCTPPSRGLFITRAQPFHVGHRAFVRQIAAERDEVIVLVAKANASHTLDNPATAGERLEMVHALLEAEVPGRYHLVAAPYVDDDAANFAELDLLVPPYDAVYCNSPSTATLAESDGHLTIALAGAEAASGTEIRRRILFGEPYEELVPEEVMAVLARSAVPERLRRLGGAEARGTRPPRGR